MKRIAFFNSNKAWGGGEKWHFNMAMALKKQGHHCFLITNIESELAVKAKEAGFDVIEISVGNLSFLNPFKWFKLKKIFNEIKVQNVFMNLPSDVKLCAPIAKVAGVEKTIYRRGMPKDLKNNFINRFVFKRVDTFIANSMEIKRTITKNLPELDNKTQIIFNGVHPLEHEIDKNKELSSPLILGNLGRLVEQKGQAQLIDIALELIEKRMHFEIHIAGKGPLQSELEKKIRGNNLGDYVKLLGHVKPEEFFNTLDIFVFTSHFEGSANALIESLQYNIPAIAWDISSNPEVIEDGVNGYLIKPFQVEDFAEKIVKLSEDKEKYQQLKEKAQLTIETKFNYSHKIQEVVNLLC